MRINFIEMIDYIFFKVKYLTTMNWLIYLRMGFDNHMIQHNRVNIFLQVE